VNGLSRCRDYLAGALAAWEFVDGGNRRAERMQLENAEIISGYGHGVVSFEICHTAGNKKAARVAGGCRDI
jgi:hypothetical protein